MDTATPEETDTTQLAAISTQQIEHATVPASRVPAGHRPVSGRASGWAGTSVWLCAPGPHEPDPDLPRWASTLVARYSIPGQRVEVRVAAVYAGLAGEVAALLYACALGGHDVCAVLPTPRLAARARALVSAFTHPRRVSEPGPPAGLSTRRVRVTVADAETTPSEEPIGLIVVLAGPVQPGATPPLPAVSPRTVGVWARRLAPGGVLALLCPPPTRATAPPPNQALNQTETETETQRESGGGCDPLIAAARAELSYLQHVVFVHVPIRDDALIPAVPETGGPAPGSGPFWPVHTDAFVFLRHPRPRPVRSLPPSPAPPLTDLGGAAPAPAVVGMRGGGGRGE